MDSNFNNQNNQQAPQDPYQGQPMYQNQQAPQGQPMYQNQQPYQGQPMYQNQQYYGQQQPMPQGSQAKAIASMVLGILSIIFCCIYTWVALVLAIVGLVLAILSKKNNEPGKGFATAGLVCSIIGLAIAIISIIIAIVFVSILGESLTSLADYLREMQY